MKYIKLYEGYKPKIGDYVVINSEYPNSEVSNFLENTVGQIIDLDEEYPKESFKVKYENYPKTIERWFMDGCRWHSKYDIIMHSDNKEDLILKLAARKYNL